MAFDVYVGTMTRYYRRDWENVAKRFARQQGIRYTTIHVGGDPSSPPPANEIRRSVETWWKPLSRALESQRLGPVQWLEDDDQPYFTERPTWDGYTALLIWAAHAEHPDLPLPDKVPQSWTDDSACERSTDPNFKSRFRTILEPQLWLPTEFPFVFPGPTLTSDKTCLGSVFTLRQQLEDLNKQTGEKLRELKATRAIPVPEKRAGFLSRFFSPRTQKRQPEKAPLAEYAESGMAIFRELAGKASEFRLPMILDY